MELVTEGSEEESKVHDETSNDGYESNAVLSAEMSDQRGDSEADCPGCCHNQGGSKVG